VWTVWRVCYLPVPRCSAVEIALSSKVLEVFEDLLCVLELLEGMRRVLEAVEICALYAVGTASEVAEIVLKVVEVVLKGLGGCAEGGGGYAEGGGGCARYAEGSEWFAMCAMGHALHAVLNAASYVLRMQLCILEAVEGEFRLLEVLLREL